MMHEVGQRRMSLDLYQLFFNGADEAIFGIEAATQAIVAANQQASRWTGYRNDELLGLRMGGLLQAQNTSEVLALLSRGHSANTIRDCRLRLRKKDGGCLAVTASVKLAELHQQRILFVIASADHAACAHENAATLDTALEEQSGFPAIIGQSESMRQVCRRIGLVAKSETTVLLQGESGTGKEVVANAVHAHSLRARGAFVRVNCASLSETLLESELFGHVRGAFTGAMRDRHGRFKQADGGTILLDEIGCLSLAGQAKLLRVLQEHEFEPVGSSVTTSTNVRVLASTNSDLQTAVAAGKFREDLFYRLNVFVIHLPPLRERQEDIPLLAQHFLRKCNQCIGKDIRACAPETLEALMAHDWPGNVRELENAIEHAVIVEKGALITPASLPMNLSGARDRQEASGSTAELGLRDMLNLLEKQILLNTLVRANGIKKRAAALLHIDARNLPYLLRKHNLSEISLPNGSY